MNASSQIIFTLLLGLNGMIRVYVSADQYYKVFSIKSVGQAPSGKTVCGINAPNNIDPQDLLKLCDRFNDKIDELATNKTTSSLDINDVYKVIINSGDSPIYINAFICMGSETNVYLRVDRQRNDPQRTTLYGYSK